MLRSSKSESFETMVKSLLLHTPRSPHRLRYPIHIFEHGPSPDTDQTTARPAEEKDFHREEASRFQHFRFALAVSRERQARTDVLLRQIGEIPQNVLMRHAAGEIFQHVVDGDAQPANARFSTPLARLHRNNVSVTHSHTLSEKPPPGNWKQMSSRTR